MEKLGKYLLVRRLGAGGMGVVYEAHDPDLHRQIAIKLLPAGHDGDTRRFKLEAKAAAQVNHPNCVHIYEIDEDAGRPFIVMELVRGLNAGEFVERSGPPAWGDATKILAHACRGLTAIHEKGLIHRDVKPSNLLISETGTVKLADFGLAKAIGQGTHSLSGDRTVGTPHFMSPEQCWNEPVDARTDIYALGATYYALLTGRPPFQAERDLQVMFAHCNNPAPDPRAVRPDLPEGCNVVIQKAMAKAPAERYQTAGELQAALEAVLAANAPTTSLAADATLAATSTAELPALSLTLPSTDPDISATTATELQPLGVSRRRALFAVIPAVAAIGTGVFFGLRGCTGLFSGGGQASGDGKDDAKGPGDGKTPGPGASQPDGIPPIQDGTVWDIGAPIRGLAISDDSRWVAVGLNGGQNERGVKLFDRKSDSREPALWRWKTGACNSVAFSPDGSLLAVASEDVGRVIVWSLAEQRELSWKGLDCGSPVGAVGFSPNGKLFVAALNPWQTEKDQPVVRVWRVAEGKGTQLRDLNGGSVPIRQLSFAPDNKTLAAAISPGFGRVSVKRSRQVDVWDVEAPNIDSINTPGVEVGPSAVFARKAWVLAVARADLIDIFLTPALDKQRRPWNTRREPFSIALAPDGKLLAAAFQDGINLYDTETGQPREKKLDRHTAPVFALTFTADGRHLVSCGSHDNTVRFWDVPS